MNILFDTIGNEMINCTKGCSGIEFQWENGTPPRGLFFQTEHRNGMNGCAIIGINPGSARKDESKFYIKNLGKGFSEISEYFGKIIQDHRYYNKVRRLLTLLDLEGPILWSELVKCQNAKDTKGLPPQITLRTCTNNFLLRELKGIPQNWPILGLGNEAYKALAYLLPKRTVIGVPHPTGSYGYFDRMYKYVEQDNQYKDHIINIINANNGQIHKLSEKNT